MNFRSTLSVLLFAAPLVATAPLKRAYVNPGSLTEVAHSGDTFTCRSFEGPVQGRVLSSTGSTEAEQLIVYAAAGPLPGTLVPCKPDIQASLQDAIKNITGTATHFRTDSPYWIPGDPDMKSIEGVRVKSDSGECKQNAVFTALNGTGKLFESDCSDHPASGSGGFTIPIPTLTGDGHGTTETGHTTEGEPHHRRTIATPMPIPTANELKKRALNGRINKPTAKPTLSSKMPMASSRTMSTKSQDQSSITSLLDELS